MFYIGIRTGRGVDKAYILESDGWIVVFMGIQNVKIQFAVGFVNHVFSYPFLREAVPTNSQHVQSIICSDLQE